VRAVVAPDVQQARVHRLDTPERADDDLEEGRARARQHERGLADAEDDQEKRQQGDLRHGKHEREIGLDEIADGPRDAHEEPERDRRHRGEHEREGQPRQGHGELRAEIARRETVGQHPADRGRRREVAR
jgi:hypothetical protein